MNRDTTKRIARVAASAIFATPAILSFRLRSRVMGCDRALAGSTQRLARMPGLYGEYVRRAFLVRALAQCSPTATIEFGVLFSKAGARIGDRAYIGPRCHLGLVTVEHDALLAAGVHVTSGANLHGTDDVSVPIRDQPGVVRMVTIGAGAWIGSGAIVMADVGRDAIVGAGAVVTSPIPDRAVAVGVPARVIRMRE